MAFRTTLLSSANDSRGHFALRSARGGEQRYTAIVILHANGLQPCGLAYVVPPCIQTDYLLMSLHRRPVSTYTH
jgi:hypothetical protein